VKPVQRLYFGHERVIAMMVTVTAAWDAEAEVWYIVDSNVPGLHIEAETPTKLYEKLDGAIEDLLGPEHRELHFIRKAA
jgi:hypothetical protein